MKSTLSRILALPMSRRCLTATLQALRVLCLSDRLFMGLFSCTFRRCLPQASRMLDHYRNGTGAAVQVRADDLVSDPGFLARLSSSVNEGALEGQFEVPQWHLESLDLRCALGSFLVNWRQTARGLTLCCTGDYAWRPNDHQRPTAPIHRAASALPGAAAFQWTSHHDCMERPAHRSWMPRDRVYM